MKKFRVFSIILLMLSTAAFVVFQVYIRQVQDTVPPVVTCDSEEITVDVEAPEEELFKGVQAMDKRCGDVSDTLVIEKMSGFTEEGTRVITYAAVDESKNVGRCERILKYEGYKPPKFDLEAPLCFPVGRKMIVAEHIRANSVLDGDLSDNIKYTLEESINTMEEGVYPIEFRVMDSGGKNVYLLTEIEVYGREYMGIGVELKDYLVYAKKGKKFNASKYYKGTDYAGEVSLEIDSNVNVNKEGVYQVDYIVSNGALKGKSRLLVVVQ